MAALLLIFGVVFLTVLVNSLEFFQLMWEYLSRFVRWGNSRYNLAETAQPPCICKLKSNFYFEEKDEGRVERLVADVSIINNFLEYQK